MHPCLYITKKLEFEFLFVTLPRVIITIWSLASTLPSVIPTNTRYCYYGNSEIISLFPLNFLHYRGLQLYRKCQLKKLALQHVHTHTHAQTHGQAEKYMHIEITHSQAE